MVDTPKRPVLNPVLRFTQDPKPKRVSGGGKSAVTIIKKRLDDQRQALSDAFSNMAEDAENHPSFGGQVVVYAEMFDDSLAPSYTPADLFHPLHSARLITPHRSGYLVQIRVDKLADLARTIASTSRVKEMVDISRVKDAGFFSEGNALADRDFDTLWNAAPENDKGRAFVTWFMPLRDRERVRK
jgi:hypothetical protein